MKNQRRKFSTEFKTKVLQEVKLNQNAIIAIAKKFDLSPAQIYSWKRKSDDTNWEKQNSPLQQKHNTIINTKEHE